MKTKNCLISWLGFYDLEKKIEHTNKMAPLETILFTNTFEIDKVIILYDEQNHKEKWHYQSISAYLDDFNRSFHDKKVLLKKFPRLNASDPNVIFRNSLNALRELSSEEELIDCNLYFNFSSGTNIMKVCWTLLSRAGYNAILIQSWYHDATKATKCESIDISVEIDIKLDQLTKDLKSNEKEYKSLDSVIDLDSFIGEDFKIRTIKDEIVKLSFYDKINVLIIGESGTGKEGIARLLHDNSPRRKQHYEAINISAIPDTLIESELFGYKKGAFTGADKDTDGLIKKADHGTLFMDEIGDLPLYLQPKILRVIQEGKFKSLGSNEEVTVDVRFISATHTPENLRNDLFYRLADFVINLPPLRERGNDVILLSNHFLYLYNTNFKTKNKSYIIKNLNDKAISFLKTYTWPGNIRELQSVIKRCCFNSDDITIDEAIIKKNIFPLPSKNNYMPTIDFPLKEDFKISVASDCDRLNIEEELKTIKLKVIHYLIKTNDNKQKKAADFLGMKPQALSRYLKEKQK